ncbi:pseudouridine synthase, RluA family [Halobacteroides halobius DSM 5150]|uniref:Pseudouridine synthase n=1 Tax=Halobacteroides halobius (strain ATCC 35273 / DSM 5150 / MD-1) TaxID=748449 RepID=L0K8K9_HALHC|nr:RluA family pseudouridine synthase [Halobacteroides halobius]AGB40870.1 pseudouridine synthase, RluA family [Halobacteroides halobius DSM 5150]
MEEEKEFRISDKDNEQRIDKFLANKNDDLSRNYIQKLIKSNQVVVNGQRIKKSYELVAGDNVKLIIPEPKELDLEPQDIPLNILYDDNDIIVINKQPDLVVHPAPGHESGTLVNALLYHCDNLSGINGVIRPGIVHRLDKDTSGAMVVAKNDEAHIELARQFKERETKKIYTTLVYGRVRYNKGQVDAAIGRDPYDRKKMAVTSKNSKKAISYFEVKKRYSDYTLVEVKLETGRTHQIRLHMDYMGHSIVGDELYGPKLTKTKLDVSRQMLHARKLGLYHPRTGDWMEFDAPLLDDMKQVLDNLE